MPLVQKYPFRLFVLLALVLTISCNKRNVNIENHPKDRYVNIVEFYYYLSSKEEVLKKIKETKDFIVVEKTEQPWFDFFINGYYFGATFGNTSFSLINKRTFLNGENKLNLVLREKYKKNMCLVIGKTVSLSKVIVYEIFEFNGNNIKNNEVAFSFTYPFTKNIIIGE